MLKNCCILLLVLFVETCASAQPIHKKAHVRWGQKTKATPRTSLKDVIGRSEAGFYVTKFNAQGWYGFFHSFSLEHYDNNLNLKATQDIKLDFPEGKRQLAFVLHLGQQLYLFTSFHDRSNKKAYLYVQDIDKESLKPGKSRKIAEADVESRHAGKAISFGYTLSPDSSALLVYCDMPSKKKEAGQTELYVFDQNIHPVWQRKVLLPPDQHEPLEMTAYAIDNERDVYLLGQVSGRKQSHWDNPAENSSKQTNYPHQVLHYQNLGATLHQYPLTMGHKYLKDARLRVTKDQQVLCVGFYADKSGKDIAGSFLMNIDGNTNHAMSPSFQPLEADCFSETSHNNQEKITKSLKLSDYVLRDVVLRENGGVTLVAEQLKVKAVSSFLSGIFSTGPYKYYNAYENILIVDLDHRGKIHWAQQIYKDQPSANNSGLFSSYAMSVVGDKLYFIFNDNPKNLINRSGKVHPLRLRDKSTIVAMVEIDAYGHKTKSPLFMRYDSGVITRPQVCQQLSASEMVIFGQYKRSQKIGRISFVQPIDQITSKQGKLSY